MEGATEMKYLLLHAKLIATSLVVDNHVSFCQTSSAISGSLAAW